MKPKFLLWSQGPCLLFQPNILLFPLPFSHLPATLASCLFFRHPSLIYTTFLHILSFCLEYSSYVLCLTDFFLPWEVSSKPISLKKSPMHTFSKVTPPPETCFTSSYFIIFKAMITFGPCLINVLVCFMFPTLNCKPHNNWVIFLSHYSIPET